MYSRRVFQRMPVNFDIQINQSNQIISNCSAKNISLGGILFECGQTFKKGEKIELLFSHDLPSPNNPIPDLYDYRIEAIIRQANKSEHGFKYSAEFVLQQKAEKTKESLSHETCSHIKKYLFHSLEVFTIIGMNFILAYSLVFFAKLLHSFFSTLDPVYYLMVFIENIAGILIFLLLVSVDIFGLIKEK